MARYIIVGGVAGGMSAAARLRRLNESADIIIFEKGEYVSFANCGLPYYVGGVINDRSKLMVQTPEILRDRLKLDIRTQTEVTSIDPQAITVYAKTRDGQMVTETYDKLILAPGAEPIRPPLPGIDHSRIVTVRSIPDVDSIKQLIGQIMAKDVVVIGGGFIGIEMADNLMRAGLNVHLVEMTNQVLPHMLDFDLATLVHAHLRSKGLQLHFGSPVQAFVPKDDGIIVELADGQSLPSDLAVLSIGVRPDVTLAKAAGLQLGPRGGIAVNESLQTSDPSIYAVGDAIEVLDYTTGASALIPLAGPANKQGRMAADNICGLSRTYRGTQGTSIVDAIGLTVAGTGANSKSLQRAGINYITSTTHSFPHATYYPGGTMMAIKLLFSPEGGRILGAQIVGVEGVDKRIDVLATTLRFGGTIYDLQELELAYAPAFSSAKDPVNIAGFAAVNILEQRVRTVQATEVADLMEKVTFIDVRDSADHVIDSIPGSINIPLPQLRQRITEIPREKPCVVYCRIGHQAYVASRVLMQSGLTDVANLSGGWRSYHAIKANSQTDKVHTHSNRSPGLSDSEVAAAVQEDTGTALDSTVIPSKILDVTGMACPGPIVQVSQTIEAMTSGSVLEVHATDPGFAADIKAWCSRMGMALLSSHEQNGRLTVHIRKGEPEPASANLIEQANDKTMVVFSGDLDKALAAFIIATGAAAMNRKVTMLFTFWGLNILRRKPDVRVKKGILDRMFGMMMPRGSTRLGLSRMNMGGIGPRLIRHVMNDKGITSLEDLMQQAMRSGVRIIACQMSMDVMGIKAEELLPGVEIGGVATFLGAAETADTNLFI